MNLPDSSFREKQAVGYVDLRISFWYEDNNWKVLKKLSIDSVSHGAECEPTQGESERRQEGLRPRFWHISTLDGREAAGTRDWGVAVKRQTEKTVFQIYKQW